MESAGKVFFLASGHSLSEQAHQNGGFKEVSKNAKSFGKNAEKFKDSAFFFFHVENRGSEEDVR